jgi:hypothetical protein
MPEKVAIILKSLSENDLRDMRRHFLPGTQRFPKISPDESGAEYPLSSGEHIIRIAHVSSGKGTGS